MPHLSRREMLGALAAAPAAQAARRPPNILYIMADDHASHAISAYGSRVNRTPNIDRLAQGGVRFDNCFCTNSICTPSRAAILTGQYSHRNGVYTLNDVFDGSRDHAARHLQSAGYRTAMVGKWHLGSDPTGFDYWNILPGQGVYYDPVFIDNGTRRQHKGYCTDLIAGLFARLAEGARPQPAVLPDVPSQGATPALGPGPEIRSPVRRPDDSGARQPLRPLRGPRARPWPESAWWSARTTPNATSRWTGPRA